MVSSSHKKSLLKAQKVQDDEYYTLYGDIAEEVSKYKDQLNGQRILCPCDWDESYNEEIVYKECGFIIKRELFGHEGTVKEIDIENTKEKIVKNINLIKCQFVKFLVAHADEYKIKSVSVSGYNPKTNQGVRFQNIDYSNFDVVITNPPFSQFREFINKIIDNGIRFLVIGPPNALTYKETFTYIKDNRMWLGYAKQLEGFSRPDGTKIMSRDPAGSVPRACKWFTNLDVSIRHKRMILTEEYASEKYPNYYNYDGINISKVQNIPYDYDGNMGVPVTFLQKYNPDQFEIIGKGGLVKKTRRWNGDKAALWTEKDGKPHKELFERIIIKRKN